MRKIIKIGLVGMLIGALAACSTGPTAGDTPTKSDSKTAAPITMTDVTVGIVPFSPNAILFHAMDSGIFEKHGLKVTTQPAASPIEVSAAMVSGTQQFGFITTPVLVNAAIAGTSLKCVSPIDGELSSERDASALVASKESGITTLAGFAGKKFAVVQLGSINRLGAQKLFDDAGVKNVEYVAIPFPQMPQALADGRVAGAVITSPFSGTAIAAGAKVIAHPSSDTWPNGTIYCYAGTGDYLNKNPKVAKAFQDAMKESILYTKDHEAEVLKTLVEHLKLTPEVAAKQVIPSNYVPELNVKSIDAIQAEMKRQDWIKSTVDVNALVWTAK
jgi:NitT/TauT family transport system substrate-binding protein